MIVRTLVGGFLLISVSMAISKPILRKVFGYVDESDHEYQYNKRREWLEEKKSLKVIKNSDGENWF